MYTQQNDWQDWRWQFRNRLRTEADFAEIVELTDQEKAALENPSFP